MGSFHGRRGRREKLDLLLSMQEHCYLTTIDLSSMLLGQVILTKRPMSFQAASEMKIVDNE